MKFNQIDPMAITVMADKLRLVFIGQKARSHQRPTRQGTVLVNPPLRPACAEMLAPVLEWQVNAVQVDAVQGRRLIGHLMGFSVLMQVHCAGSCGSCQ